MAPSSGGNGTGPTGTAPASVASGITDNGICSTDIGTAPCELNKLNAGKPGFWSVSLSNQGQSSACKSRRARQI